MSNNDNLLRMMPAGVIHFHVDFITEDPLVAANPEAWTEVMTALVMMYNPHPSGSALHQLEDTAALGEAVGKAGAVMSRVLGHGLIMSWEIRTRTHSWERTIEVLYDPATKTGHARILEEEGPDDDDTS